MGSNIELPQDKTNKLICVPSEDSDQHGHLPSLTSVFAVRMKKAWSLASHWVHSEDWSDWSDWSDAQADLSLRWTQSHFVGFVMRRLNYYNDLLQIHPTEMQPIKLFPLVAEKGTAYLRKGFRNE